MPLPLIPLAIGAVALLVATRKAASPASTPQLGAGLAPTKATDDTPTTNAAQGPGGALGGIVAAVGAAIAAGIGGKAIDEAINPNSNQFSQTAAGIAIGVPVGLGVLALSGAMGPILTFLGLASLIPFVGVIIGVVAAVLVLTYVVIIFAQDLARLQYGQAGARRDFVKQKNEIYGHAMEMAQAHPDAAVKDMVAVERQLVPFVEGYMARLNWAAYVGYMAKKGVVVSAEPGAALKYRGFPWADKGLKGSSVAGTFPGSEVLVTDDLLWHFNWYIDRGYLVGFGEGMRKVDAVPEFNSGWLSDDPAWVLAHCPPAEREEIPSARGLNYDDNFTVADTVYHGASVITDGYQSPNVHAPVTEEQRGVTITAPTTPVPIPHGTAAASVPVSAPIAAASTAPTVAFVTNEVNRILAQAAAWGHR